MKYCHTSGPQIDHSHYYRAYGNHGYSAINVAQALLRHLWRVSTWLIRQQVDRGSNQLKGIFYIHTIYELHDSPAQCDESLQDDEDCTFHGLPLVTSYLLPQIAVHACLHKLLSHFLQVLPHPRYTNGPIYLGYSRFSFQKSN